MSDIQVTFSEDYGASINHSDTEFNGLYRLLAPFILYVDEIWEGKQQDISLALKRGTCLSPKNVNRLVTRPLHARTWAGLPPLYSVVPQIFPF